MSAHTKGPWIAEKQPGDEWWFGGRGCAQIVIRGEAEKPYNSFAVLGVSEAGDPEQEANARLIAAAPELLEALKELIAARNEPFPPFEAGQPAQEAWVMRGVNAEAAARAAIQKAEGTT